MPRKERNCEPFPDVDSYFGAYGFPSVNGGAACPSRAFPKKCGKLAKTGNIAAKAGTFPHAISKFYTFRR
jgi:hypothetical protein